MGGCRHSGDRQPRQTDPVAVCDSVALICRIECLGAAHGHALQVMHIRGLATSEVPTQQ